MSKDELIALAREGRAHIEVANTITRYCIAPTAQAAEPSIFLSISDEDGTVYDNDAYFFGGGLEEETLTEKEAVAIRDAIDAHGITH